MPIMIKKRSKPNEGWMLVAGSDGLVLRLKKKHYGPVLNQDAQKASSRNTKPVAPVISLSEPGRLRLANLLHMFGVSRTTLHVGIKSGRYPKPDGRDGRMPYWNTATVRAWLENDGLPKK